MRQLAYIAICCLFHCSIGLANIDQEKLLNYWRVNSDLTLNSQSNHLANLKAVGVEDPNSLAIYLDAKEWELQALSSMLLLDKESKQLKPVTIQRIIAVVTNSPVASTIDYIGSGRSGNRGSGTGTVRRDCNV